jgi:L-threonylcarbamoyladenylate synthase
LKKRPFEKRLGWFIGDWRKLSEYGVDMSGEAGRLAEAFFPGALTIVAPRCNGGTQGVRVPDYPLLSALLAAMDEPLVQTSANASGNPDPLTCSAAVGQLAGEVDCAVDVGELPPGARGSTVVDAVGDKIRILRQGEIDLHNWC